jgi:hypothetical protein
VTRSYTVALLGLILITPLSAADMPPAFADVIRPTVASLCGDPAVRAELKLTAEQADKMTATLETEAAMYAKSVKALGNMPTTEVVTNLMAAARVSAAKAVDQVLTDAQQKRLRQIDLQDRGPAAFDDPGVRKALAATDEQRKKWGVLKDQFDSRLRKLKREAGGVQTTRTVGDTGLTRAGEESLDGKTVRDLKKEHWLAAKNVLSPEQLDKWYDLIGDPFPNPTAPKK